MAITKRGETWQYTLNLGIVEGKRKRISKGGFKTKKECEIAYTEIKNKYNISGQVKQVSNINLTDYMDIYYKEYVVVNCKATTQQIYRDYIKLQIVPVLGNYKLKEITPSIIYNFIIGLSKTYSKNFCNHLRGFLHSAFKFAIYPKEFITENPFANLNFRNVRYKEAKEEIVLTKEDMEKVFEYLKDYPQCLLPIQIMYHTGMRVSEVCGLSWSNVDMDNRVIHVRQQLQRIKGVPTITTPKTKGSIRNITFSNKLYEILNEKKIEYDYSSATHGLVCTCKNINKVFVFEYLKKKIRLINRDVCPFKTHAIRKLHATMLIESGVDIKTVSKRLGHSDIEITYNIYVQLSKKNIDKMTKMLDEIF